MIYKYLSLVPKPLLNDFVNNRVVPFVGAGFSKNADIPEGLSMPDWNELGKLAAAEISDLEYENNPIDVLSYYETLYSRSKLVELLMRELHVGKVHPGDTYRAFCDLFTGTICTTNFDSLLEDCMTLLHRPVSVVVTKDRLTVTSKEESKILKLHGDFNHPDKMVITEHDYDLYLERNPVFATYMSNLFITNTMLLVGYSLDDNDFRSIWQVVNNRLGGMARPAYSVMVNASPEKIAKFQRRNIRVINLPGTLKEYKKILHDFFVELKEYIANERDSVATSSSEKINEQMVIPAEDNRLCFISCTMSRMAQLSALLYPILQGIGITPIRIDDMLIPGDNWIDVSRTAIRKSKFAIVDISDSSPNVSLELGLINNEKGPRNVLLIQEENGVTLAPFANQQVIKYSFDLSRIELQKHFRNAVEAWIQKNIGTKGPGQGEQKSKTIFDRAYRLFEKEEYSASIVSAFSEFEALILSRHPEYTVKQYELVNAMMQLVKSLNSGSDKSMQESVKKCYNLRNAIVHSRYTATKEEAQDVIRFLEKLNEADSDNNTRYS